MILLNPKIHGWKARKTFIATCTVCAIFSTLIWSHVSDTGWIDQITAGVGYFPYVASSSWNSHLWAGKGRTKMTAESFLNAYNAWKSSSGDGYCTPIVADIHVTLDGQEINEVESLDVSIPHYLEINSWCDGIPGVGDFYETLLTTPYYHARINLHNQFNGNQVGEPLRIPLEMVKQGKPLRLQIWRLYRNFEGIENHHEVKAPFEDGKYTREEIIDVEIPLTGLLGRSVEDRPICHGEDFHQHEWTGGFWWRTEEMDEAWTFYLANCKAKKFTTDQASECLAGKSLVYLGDSTSEAFWQRLEERTSPLTPDMIRNTFWTLLGDTYPDHPVLPKFFGRKGHWNTTHPRHPERWTSISHLFNGHFNLGMNRLGMNSFRHQEAIETHDTFFEEIIASSEKIDTILINSGLHDCWLRPTPESFVEDFQNGWEYYMSKVDQITQNQGTRPKVIYRYSNTPPNHLNSTLATPMNPSSMEMINLLERRYLESYNLEKMNGEMTFLDSFELTWPWHFDGEMNQGPHYGRAPWDADSKRLVDVMMVQLFLNSLCPDIAMRG